MSTSHDWARDLQKTAAYILSKPEVDLKRNIPETICTFYGEIEKEGFLGLVRATKPGKKHIGEYYVTFRPTETTLQFSVNRDVICKRINPVYECTPLLSKEEDAEMESD